MTRESKDCVVCGRKIQWRKKWERCWGEVKYCGEKCRRSKASAKDSTLEEEILKLLGQRARGATICPSEVARGQGGDEDEWRALMEPVRQAARRLVSQGMIEITQKGKVADPSRAKGPIRLRLRAKEG